MLHAYKRPSEREMYYFIRDFRNFQEARRKKREWNHFNDDIVAYLGPQAAHYDDEAREILVKMYKGETYWVPSDNK
jgi:hypothetical protein